MDDDDDARSLFRHILERAGAEVTAVSTADEAYETVLDQRPDVLVSDVAMPGQDGLTLIQRLRHSDREESRLPAVALTAFDTAADRAKVLRAGFDEHISKGSSPSTVVAALAQLRSRRASRSDVAPAPEHNGAAGAR